MAANTASSARSKSASSGAAIQRSYPSAFTLIELLVVIAIVAIIISIVMPALNKARNEGNIIKCLANLRTLGQASEMYWSAQEDVKTVIWYWWRSEIPHTEPGYSVSILAPWVWGGSKAMYPGQYPNADSSVYPAEIRPLNKYLDRNAYDKQIIKAFVDPGDRSSFAPIVGNSSDFEEEEVKSSIESNGSSYSLNVAFMEGYKGGSGTFTTDDIVEFSDRIAHHLVGGSASRFIMWHEQGMGTATYRARPTLPNGAAALHFGWHRKFTFWSAGFADGHAVHARYDTRLVHGGMDGTIWQANFEPATP
jgi:prepilin-type N-terminal cleavage/methylation domain-containing protein